MKLTRIQCKRTKGWYAPKRTAYLGRPSRWGNPFVVDDYTPDREECIKAFETELRAKQKESPLWFAMFYVAPLIGYEYVSCWCSLDKSCHCDVWIKILSEYEITYNGKVLEWERNEKRRTE